MAQWRDEWHPSHQGNPRTCQLQLKQERGYLEGRGALITATLAETFLPPTEPIEKNVTPNSFELLRYS